MQRIIVSRHPGAIAWLAKKLGGVVSPRPADNGGIIIPDDSAALNVEVHQWSGLTGETYIPVVASATADDVRDKHVYGNLPFHLAAVVAKVTAIEFSGEAPRGAEYTPEQMDDAGAKLMDYIVRPADSRLMQDADGCCSSCGTAPGEQRQ